MNVDLFIVRHLILWIFFVILFTAAAMGLELAEGYKVTTTEYYGLRNLGIAFIALPFLAAAALYPVILLPLSIAIRKLASSSFIRVIIYCLLGGAGGLLIFHQLYDESFVHEYQLNVSTSILLFAASGCAYAMLDGYLARRENA